MRPNPTLELIRFGEFLCEQKLISDEELLAALADHWASGSRIGDVVARHGYLSRDEIERQASRYHGLAVIEVGAC